jgi:hypothetical protein
MADEPGEETGAAGSLQDPSTVPSTEIVVSQRRHEVVAPGRWAPLVAGLRGRLLELRRHPAAVASVSAATTIGGALLINGLRHAARAAATPRPAPTGSTVVGYVLHEVHVFHHVRQQTDRHDSVEVYTGQW